MLTHDLLQGREVLPLEALNRRRVARLAFSGIGVVLRINKTRCFMLSAVADNCIPGKVGIEMMYLVVRGVRAKSAACISR
jgi:hypothetical protein